MVKSECKELKAKVSEILAASKQKDGERLRTLCQDGKLLLMKMKDSNRQQCEKIESLREETAAAKAELDSLNLVLQNLLYEKSYYEKEIRACQDFHSAYPDEDVGLLPLAEYVKATGDAEALEDHKTMLRRLTHEQKRRIELHERLESVKKQRLEMQSREGKEHSFLKSIVDHLAALDKAAEAVKEKLQVKRGAMSFLSRHADLLPTPLYVLYSQLAACIDAHDLPATVRIEGSIEEAEAFAAQLASDLRSRRQQENAESVANGDVEMADEHARHGHQPHQALASNSTGTKKDIYLTHPLKVILTILESAADELPIIAVAFHYIPSLNVVTAETLESMDNILLANLFPGDIGAETPNEANRQLNGGAFQFDLSRPARPYRWVQHLAGLDFLPAVPGMALKSDVEEGLQCYRSEARHLAVLQRLRERKSSTSGLKLQLEALSKGSLITKLSSQASASIPLCKINSWKEAAGTGGGGVMLLSAAYSRLLGPSIVSACAEAGEVPSSSSPAMSSTVEEAAEKIIRENWHTLGARTFKCTLRHGDVDLDAMVQITLDYPQRPALISLSKMQWPATLDGRRGPSVRLPATELQAFETEVNLWSAKFVASEYPDPNSLLLTQITALMTTFDVYAQQAMGQRALLVAGAPAVPKVTRGRDLRRTIDL